MNYSSFVPENSVAQILVEKQNGCHYIRGGRVRRHERRAYMSLLLDAARIALKRRRDLRKQYPNVQFG